MKPKTLITIFAIILLIGIATASTATLTNPQIIKNLTDFIAGGTTSTEFSFDYPGDLDNDYTNAPLVARINISCLDEEENCSLDDCSVLKGDFFPVMTIQRYWLPKILGKLIPIENPIPMTCKEKAPIKFKPKEGTGWIYTIDEVPKGTFYCYNPNYYLLQLSSRNFVSLNINSNLLLYPGKYSVSVDLLEMEPGTTPEEPEGYIHILSIKAINNSNIIPYETNQTVIFNITLEIKGGNAIKMWMSNLTKGYGESYSAEDLNATLTYYNGTEYQTYYVKEDYDDAQDPIIFIPDDDGIVRATVIFKMDIEAGMEPGTYHGTYRFNVTEI